MSYIVATIQNTSKKFVLSKTRELVRFQILYTKLPLSSLGLSRQFGFAQFATMPDASEFLERHYPSISLYGPYDPTQAADTEAAKVRIAFSRDKDDRDRPGKNDDDWNCEIV